jgi:hypothetical protein
MFWFVHQIYYSSLQVGPEHVSTTGGYYQMGNIFMALKQNENALAMYEKVEEIWHNTLKEAIKTLEETGSEVVGQ